MMFTLAGDAETAKFPVGFTVSVSADVCAMSPDVPRIVTTVVPIGAVPVAVSVNVLVFVVLLGLKDAVTPLGNPEAENVTLPVKPFFGVIVIVLVPLVPCVMVRLPEDVEREKFGPEVGQLFTRLAALTLPIPVAKSHPVVAG